MQVWRAVSLQIILAAAVILVSAKTFPPVVAADENNNLARAVQLYQEVARLTGQDQYQNAIPLAQEAVSIQEKELGPDHPNVAQGLNILALLYFKLGRYAEAEPLYKRSLDLTEKAHGPDDPAVAASLDSLAQVYVNLGRYAEGEALEKRELAIREKASGPDNSDVAHTLNNIAEIYRTQGRTTEAEPLYKRSLEIFEKALGPDHLEVAAPLTNLANLYVFEGRYAEAEALLKRALTVREKALGPEHPDIGVTVASLAQLYIDQGRYTEAEPLLKRGSAIFEKAFGSDHPNVAANLNYLAVLYVNQGRNSDAEPLFERSIAIYEKLGSDSPYLATVLNNLALSYVNQGLYAKAEPLYQRSFNIIEKALGPESTYVATGLNNLAGLYVDEGKYAEAEPLYQRSLQIDEKALGPDHPDVAISLNNLGDLYSKEARYTQAEPLYQRSLAINEKALGPTHPNVATSLNNLALLYRDQHRDSEALDLSRRAVSALSRRFSEMGSDRDGGSNIERNSQRSFFTTNVSLVVSVGEPEATAESFRAAQLASASAAAQAVAGMAARFAAGSDALAAVVRGRQDLKARWQALDKAIVTATSQPPDKRDPGAEEASRKEFAETEAKLTQLDARIARDFPQYADLSNPKPLELADAQALLGPEEAMLVYLFDNQGSWLWAIRRDRAAVYKLDITAGGLSDEVIKLRLRLDPETNSDLTPFDAKRAYSLYDKILGPATTLLDGIQQVLVVPDGALASLPLGVLVTKPPATNPDRPGDHRDLAWLAKDKALSVLPSVGSLKSLRQFTQGGRGDRAFIGFGNPKLDGKPGSQQGVKLASLFRGSTADVDAVRHLPPLPETADELRAVARDLGAGEDDLYLGDRATEPLLRQAALDKYRVIEFATHGLMSGDLQGLAEPALVLTPPTEPGPSNDGLLTASKIATLKLAADWVVLSACNTAASDGTPDAGGLSGLAKAFFYAGARALLVSNWDVPSAATVKLITGTFDALKKDPAIGHAEALRRAELAMLDPQNPPEYAHPMMWAPFILTGEGGAGR